MPCNAHPQDTVIIGKIENISFFNKKENIQNCIK